MSEAEFSACVAAACDLGLRGRSLLASEPDRSERIARGARLLAVCGASRKVSQPISRTPVGLWPSCQSHDPFEGPYEDEGIHHFEAMGAPTWAA